MATTSSTLREATLNSSNTDTSSSSRMKINLTISATLVVLMFIQLLPAFVPCPSLAAAASPIAFVPTSSRIHQRRNSAKQQRHTQQRVANQRYVLQDASCKQSSATTTMEMAAIEDPASFFPITLVSITEQTIEQTQQLQTTMQQTSDTVTTTLQPAIEQLSPTTTLVVFIIGIIPFLWATVEFWRRIAFGESFGTTADSVVIPSPFDNNNDDNSRSEKNKGVLTIGEDGDLSSSRGRRTLDRGALVVAYVLFAVAAFVVGIAIASVVMGPQTEMPMQL
eukprot:scaffold6254_cov172-Alexandrium_tamarense.AAC.2